MARQLVVGGSGFIGSRLTQALVDDGNQVRIFDVLKPEFDREACEYLCGDVRDRDAISAAMAGVDVVFHCAAQQPVSQKNTRTAAMLMQEVNVEGTFNVLAAARNSRISKVIFVSSSAIYGVPAENPITDQTSPRPIEDYGRSKLAAERHCRDFAGGGLDVTIIRPPPVMGAGRLGVFQILFDWISRGYNIPVLGCGDQLQQWIHIDDCIDACRCAADRAGSAQYNIGAPAERTLRQLLEGLIRHAGSSSKVRSFPRRAVEVGIICGSWLGVLPIAPFHALTYGASAFADVTSVRRELGWQARHDQVTMFQSAYDWYVARRTEIAARETGSQHQRAPDQRLMRLGRFIP